VKQLASSVAHARISMGLQPEVLSMDLVCEPLAVELRSCVKALQQAEATAKMHRQ